MDKEGPQNFTSQSDPHSGPGSGLLIRTGFAL